MKRVIVELVCENSKDQQSSGREAEGTDLKVRSDSRLTIDAIKERCVDRFEAISGQFDC
jgi:hypothetical protein